MLEKLDGIEQRYDELTRLIADPAIIADQSKWQKMVKEHASLEEMVQVYREYKKTGRDLADARDMLKDKPDKELKELLEEEIKLLKDKYEFLEDRLRRMLLPKDPNDEKNVIMEIRAGTGGEEAALFAADLFRMYTRYAERQGWKIDVMNSNYTDIGGIKEIVFVIEGRGAYSRLKYESGVHRVQRIPATEAGGRIHTSAATVAVLPEAKEVDVEINPDEIRVDVYRSSGHGGQSVNTTDSAVRITHLPTGMVVTCQDEKSQLKNREKALRVLRARLLEKMQQEQEAEIAQARRSQVGSGDRSERIRTYNFPQSRVTDHRIGLTLHRLESVLDGDIDEIINALITSDEAERLKKAE